MNSTLSFTTCATILLPARAPLIGPTGSQLRPPHFEGQECLDHKTVAARTNSLSHRSSSHKRKCGDAAPLHTRTRQITIFMTTDTGCQLVLVGIKFFHSLKQLDLVPVKTKLLAANSRDSYPTTVRKIWVLESSRNRTSWLGDRQDTRCMLELGSLCSTSRASDQPLSNLCPLAQLQQAHAVRSETVTAPYASSRHHYQQFYHFVN